jgi:hypothetical protein
MINPRVLLGYQGLTDILAPDGQFGAFAPIVAFVRADFALWTGTSDLSQSNFVGADQFLQPLCG